MTIKRKTMITGSLIAGAVLGTGSLSAAKTNLFNYNDLGSGSVVRAKLLNQTEVDYKAFLLELNCGEKPKKETEVKKNETKKAENKSKEAKCGEGKCGENKDKQSKDLKAETQAKSDTTAKESKSKEAKCGEGKCGVE